MFDYVVLDYFRSPAGWARSSWAASLFHTTLPSLSQGGYLAQGGKILLPNQRGCAEHIGSVCRESFQVKPVPCGLNPLYTATDEVYEELVNLEDGHTNVSERQRGNLVQGAEFLQLMRIGDS